MCVCVCFPCLFNWNTISLSSLKSMKKSPINKYSGNGVVGGWIAAVKSSYYLTEETS